MMDYSTDDWEQLTPEQEQARRIAVLQNRYEALKNAVRTRDNLLFAALTKILDQDIECTGQSPE